MPNEPYEQACRDFLNQVLDPERASRVVQDIAAFVGRIAPAGVVNSLSQTLLRLVCPGVPDLYQGTEYWDFSLVDPDNRRPVDFPAREASLEAGQAPAALLPGWRDGRVKQAVITRALHLRDADPALFTEGSYLPLTIEGPAAAHVIGLARMHEGRALLAFATRLPGALGGIDELPLPDAAAWDQTFVEIPRELQGRRISDVLAATNDAGRELSGKLPINEILATLPVALLEAR